MSYDFSRVITLVVETTPEMYRLLRDVLVILGASEANIYSAYSCEEAFDEFCLKRPDLVITDWLASPDKGIELTKLIRTNKKSFNHFTPIIMTAGSSHYSRVIKSRDAGVNEYLVKPFSAQELARRIARVIEKPRPYVISPSYTGPDRRIRAVSFEGEDRRKETQKVEMVG